jgi:hypothetical protein
MALRGRFAAHLAYHEGDARASGVNSADARVGQPLSAGSVAGVHRRANRQAVRHGY